MLKRVTLNAVPDDDVVVVKGFPPHAVTPYQKMPFVIEGFSMCPFGARPLLQKDSFLLHIVRKKAIIVKKKTIKNLRKIPPLRGRMNTG